MEKKLYRSQTNRVLAGIAGGLGEYFDVDPTIIRLLFILMIVFGGSGIIIYLILWILMPNNPEENLAIDKDRIKKVAEEIKDKAGKMGEEIKDEIKKEPAPERTKRSGGLFGWILIIVGAVFLINAFSPIAVRFFFSRFWALGLILLGLIFIVRASARK
jgi:phage shock protein C